ncbi:MAG: epoxyqueuosine reductase [Caldicoprobacterales bacterium]
MKGKIKSKAAELGFSQVSIIPVQPLPLWEEGIERCKTLDANSTDYWESRGLVSDFKAVMEDAKTIIAAAFPYQPKRNSNSPGQGFYSAHYEAYPKGRNAIAELGKLLTEKGYNIAIDPPVSAKQIAYISGLGRFGKNSLIHHHKLGSFLTLHTLLTNAEIRPDEIEIGEISDCGTCRLCIDACPMQAIAENGLVLASRCLRFYMLSPEIIPVEIRERIGNRIIGCDDCQIVCPRNNAVIQQTDMAEAQQNIFDIRKLLSDAGKGLKKHMDLIGERIGRNYARSQRILSMAVIVAGNSCDDSYIPLLAETLHHPHPPIRAHSAWAIGKLGGKNAKELLITAQAKEKDLDVQREISLALQKVTEID